jgi:hypothetical protein
LCIGHAPGGNPCRVARGTLRDRAHTAVGHDRVAGDDGGGNVGLQSTRAGRGPETAQADPAQRHARPLCREPRRRQRELHDSPRIAECGCCGDVFRSKRRIRRFGRRRIQLAVRILSADERIARRSRSLRPRAGQRGQSDVALAHAAQQRSLSRAPTPASPITAPAARLR